MMVDFYKGDVPIIDDSPSQSHIVRPAGVGFGLIPRDYNIDPIEMFDPPSAMPLIEESEWDARFDEQEALKSSLEHLYLTGGPGGGLAFINLNQSSDGYCLAPGTMVRLADGSEKAVEEFAGGEMVLTHLGRARKVLRPTSREYTGKLITAWGMLRTGREITATACHQFLTPSGEWRRLDALGAGGGVVFDGRSCRLNESPDVREVKDFTVHCLEVEEDHSFIANGFTVHNCWGYSTGHALMFLRLIANDPMVRLNPHATCAIIKNGRNEGGWCGLSAKWATEHGYAVEGTGPGEWPFNSRDLRRDTPALRAAMKLHRTAESWVDLTRNIYDQNLTRKQFASALIAGIPCPCDWNAWQHSVCAIRWVRIESGSWGPLIINSWANWGRNGLGVVRFNNGTPNGAVALRATTPSMT